MHIGIHRRALAAPFRARTCSYVLMGAYSLLCGLWLSISNSDQPDVLELPPFREVGYYEKCRIVIWQKIEKIQ